MIGASFDDLIWDDYPPQEKRSPGRSKNAKIENQDGSVMFDAEAIPIEIEEIAMTINTSQPLTLGWAITLSGALFVSALGIAAGTYALIHSDVNGVRDGASSDVNLLRKDMREDFARVDSKLDAITSKLDSKIEKSSEKTDSKIDRLTDAINGIAQSKPAN